MTHRSVFASLAVAAALLPATSQASVDWGWQFTTPNLGTVGATDVLHIQAVMSNGGTATEVVDMSRGMGTLTFSGISGYSWGFGHDASVSMGSFISGVSSISLAPGESRTFDFLWFAPQGSGALPGTYSPKAGMAYWYGMTELYREHTLTWQVANASAVPEPSHAAMQALGLLCLGAGARRLRSQRR